MESIEELLYQAIEENDMCIRDADGCNYYEATKEAIPDLIESLEKKGLLITKVQ